MADDKQPRAAGAGTLLSQWWTLGAILADRRTAGRHGKVAWVIIDRYMQKKGNGRASIRYIEKAAGASQHTVIKACRELVEWGYLTQRIGVGTRPTEYSPNWLVLHPSTALPSAEPVCSASAEPMCSTSDSSAEPMCSESYLPEPADRPSLRVSSSDNTPDPLVAGLSAATGSGDPESKFDIFWSAFPRKHGRKKAEAAWNKISPDDELADTIIAAARELANHYDVNPVDKKWMKLPANWLDGKGWTEDLPSVYADPVAKRKAGTKVPEQNNAAVVDDDDEPIVEWTGEISPFVPAGAHKVKVSGATEEINEIGRKLTLVLNIDVGGTVISEVPTSFYVEHPYKEVQELGQDRLRVICSGDSVEVAADLVGREFRLRVTKDGALTYLPLIHNASPGLKEKLAAARASGGFSGEREAA